MIKIENEKVLGLEQAIHSIRLANGSMAKSDSYKTYIEDPQTLEQAEYSFVVGDNDANFMDCHATCGPNHSRFLKYINVYIDISAPIYWWREFNMYQLDANTNDFGIMYKFHDKPFDISDFSCEELFDKTDNNLPEFSSSKMALSKIIGLLNFYRDLYMSDHNKKYWWQIMQLLPASYIQKRSVMMSYDTLKKVYTYTRNDKVAEWKELCSWIEQLPHSYLITGKRPDED